MAKHAKKLKVKKLSRTRSLTEKQKKESNASEMSSQDDDNILDYFNLCTKFESYITEYRSTWKATLEEYLVFYKVDISDRPKIVLSIKIDKNLNVSAFTECGEVKKKYLKFLLNQKLVLEHWSQLKNLLFYFGTENIESPVSTKYNLTQALSYLQDCLKNSTMDNDTIGFKTKLEFLCSQIYAMIHNKFTQNVIFLAYSMYLKSSSCYKYLLSLNCIILPKEEDLINYVNYIAEENM